MGGSAAVRCCSMNSAAAGARSSDEAWLTELMQPKVCSGLVPECVEIEILSVYLTLA